MNAVRISVGLLLGTATLTGCDDRSTPTAWHGTPTSFAVSEGSGKTSLVLDAGGDVKNDVPAWLDFVSASITNQGNRFLFAWDVAAPVPADPASDPAIPAHSDHVCLFDQLDTGPTTAPVGYPLGKNTPTSRSSTSRCAGIQRGRSGWGRDSSRC